MTILPYQYITESKQRDMALKELKTCPNIGVDIEGDSLFHYQDKVCLIQISGNGRNFIFDPLLLDSVDALSSLFQDVNIIKIFHGAEYDLISLKRDFKFKFVSIFDTVLAARAIGIKSFSLQSLVSKYFDIQLEKSHQKANWSKRPIQRELLEYAYKDTFFLSDLYEKLLIEVKNKGRLDQIEEEFHLLENKNWEEKKFSSDHFLKIKGARKLSILSQKILRELVMAREEMAQRLDRPPFKVIGNEELIQISEKKPHSLEELKVLFPKESAPVYRNPVYWLKVISQGERSRDPLPSNPKKNGILPTPEQEKRFVELRKWRDQQALEEGVEPSMVISTDTLRSISLKNINCSEQLEGTGLLRQWQIRRYSSNILTYFS